MAVCSWVMVESPVMGWVLFNRMRLDALGQAVVHRPDLDFRLEHPEAPLDVSERLVALHHLGGRQVRRVGHQQQFAVHQARVRQSPFIDRVGRLGIALMSDV